MISPGSSKLWVLKGERTSHNHIIFSHFNWVCPHCCRGLCVDGWSRGFFFFLFFFLRIKFQNNPAKSHSSPHLLPHCSAVWGAFCVLFLDLMFCGWFSLLLKDFFYLRESQLVFRTSYESVNMNVCVRESVCVCVFFFMTAKNSLINDARRRLICTILILWLT